jgi:hypothetical protein
MKNRRKKLSYFYAEKLIYVVAASSSTDKVHIIRNLYENDELDMQQCKHT